MSEEILEAFREKETFNIFELMLKLKVAEIRFPRSNDSPAYEGLSSRSSIRGFSGEFYMINE
ncbi:MAG: hypothetical protein U9M96_03480 [Thermodesulfobacteriota bacterium]|nr:hypothetical protein [Thermodesulfobacteriota bacterium]